MLHRTTEVDRLATEVFLAKHFCTLSVQQHAPQERAEDVLLWMELNDIDCAPIAGTDGKMYVTRACLRQAEAGSPVAYHCQTTPEENWIEADSSLRHALHCLSTQDWLLVRDKESMVGILTIHDLSSPVVSTYLLARLLGMEHGLRRLVGTYSNQMIPDEPGEKGKKYGWTIEMTTNRVGSQKKLLRDLGYESRNQFEGQIKELHQLRNHLAHARSVLHVAKSTAEASRLIAYLERFSARVNELVMSRDAVWESFEATRIVDCSEPALVWAGAGAAALPIPGPVYVITAHNPFEKVLSESENLKRHQLMYTYLSGYPEEKGIELREVIGMAETGSWNETSWAVSGLSQQEAVAIGQRFGQRAIFRLTEDDICVVPIEGESRSPLPRRR